MMKISSKLITLFKTNSSFIISGHINPEGDSLGSSLALALGLKSLGKKDVTVLSKDPVPEILKFLPSSKIVKQQPPRKTFDVAVLVDCNELKRTGFENFNAKKIAVIDHHIVATDSGSALFYKSLAGSLIDPSAAAAGLLVYRVLKSLNVSMDKNIATNLYTAILTDTGGFRYSNASAEALQVSSALVEAGAKPWDISKNLYDSVEFRSMKLLGLSLSTLEEKDGIAWIVTSQSMFSRTGTTAEDCEDYVNFPRKVKDIEVALFFRQHSRNSYKISLRSKGRADVQKIANSFGGGGHRAAAGCMVTGSLKDVQKKVFTAVKKEIKKTKS